MISKISSLSAGIPLYSCRISYKVLECETNSRLSVVIYNNVHESGKYIQLAKYRSHSTSI